jgi:hypothetical protein
MHVRQSYFVNMAAGTFDTVLHACRRGMAIGRFAVLRNAV